MFYYFGYGSNLSVVSLRAKGVDPLTSEAAVLEGWRLVFDIPDFFEIEGGTGNIEPATGDAVHGVLHGCRSRDLARLDELEALGTRYERVETTVMTYTGRLVRAYVYLGLQSVLDKTCLPSERYRNILVRGAIDMRLDEAYVKRLKATPSRPRPARGSFVPPPTTTPHAEPITIERLKTMPACTALKGHVFDMTNARAEHAYIRRLLGGKDATLLFLKRMDTSSGMETLEDVFAERLTPEQRAYLDGYLHEFAREYQYVGPLEYPRPTAQRSASRSRPSIRPTPSWAPRYDFSTAPSELTIPSRAVLDKAESARAELRHENLGFLSGTHGFMPVDLPQAAMPKGFEAWDQVASELPHLYRSLGLRKAIDALPILRASPESLPDEALLRAALLLGMLSHAYHYVETSPPDSPPPALDKPWAEVRARLGRGPAVLTYQDLIVYNFRLLDARRSDPMALENLRLLVPTVDNREERTFYLTQTQILAYASPIVGAVVRAQEAVVSEDDEALESALMTIIACLQRIVRESLLQINPTPDAATHVDPVVWAKTVAPFAVPMQQGVQGPSGTSSPIFNMLDVFFGRKRHETFLGREIVALRDTYPPLWREFLAALQDISVPEHIESRAKPHLAGLLHEARSVYAGPNGFLGRHRMKVYGYLELAFKVGRSVTIGGFKGMFKDRTWDQVDSELERSRVERVQSFPQSCYQARVADVILGGAGDESGVFDVVLDVSGTGLRYEAGDRCGVLPENADDLVERTLAALGAIGDEIVTLSDEWRSAVRLRRGYEAAEELALRDLLRFGKIRPVHPRVAEALHALTQDEELEKALRAGTTTQWELCDVLERLRARGFDPRALALESQTPQTKDQSGRHPRWEPPAAGKNDAARVMICEIVPPEDFRIYSISSVAASADTGAATELRLTVAPLTYAGPNGRVQRGVASSFLTTARGRKEPISIMLQHPPRFGLPRDAKTPLVMIAGGTGVSPFRGFLVERQRQLAAGQTLLFLGVRTRAELVATDEVVTALKSGELDFEPAFSREDIECAWDAERGELVYREGKRRYATDLLRDERNAKKVWDLVRPIEQGGCGAYVYVCGRTRFAKSAIEALKDVFRMFASGTDAEREEQASRMLRELAAEGRYMQEIFSGEAVAEVARQIDVSELARHNDDEHGYWLLIDGRVYDVTEYVRLHPGGMRILQGYAGTDASEGYAKAHAARTEIDATREIYCIGAVRALELRGPTATLSAMAGGRVVSLSGAYRAWVKGLFLTVEMQNALRNDYALQRAATTRDEAPDGRSPYKIQKAIETHRRFLRSYVDGLSSETFTNLWLLNLGFFGEAGDEAWMSERMQGVRRMTAGRFVEAIAEALDRTLSELVSSGAGEEHPNRARLLDALAVLETESMRFLADVKSLMRDGVRCFEEYERDTPARGGEVLLATCRRLPEALRRYYTACMLRLGNEGGWRPELPAPLETAAAEEPATQRILACSKYWFVEEHFREGVVVMRRTAIPFESLEVLVAENDAVLSRIRHDHASFGVVVDMRQAPARNDPAFEGAMRTLRETVTARFARLCVLLESSAGVLQVNRLGRGEGQRAFATMSESAAMKFAKGET